MSSAHHASGLPPSLWVVNIITYVTITLAPIDGYFSWEAQFTSFIAMHQLQGMLNDTVIQSTSTILVALGVSRPNPAYSYWLRVGQLI